MIDRYSISPRMWCKQTLVIKILILNDKLCSQGTFCAPRCSAIATDVHRKGHAFTSSLDTLQLSGNP